MEAKANEDSVKMNEYEGLTETLIEMGSEGEGASVGTEIVVLLTGSGKVIVGSDDKSVAEEETIVGAGGADERVSVG
jgi:hypothetical protein